MIIDALCILCFQFFVDLRKLVIRRLELLSKISVGKGVDVFSGQFKVQGNVRFLFFKPLERPAGYLDKIGSNVEEYLLTVLGGK